MSKTPEAQPKDATFPRPPSINSYTRRLKFTQKHPPFPGQERIAPQNDDEPSTPDEDNLFFEKAGIVSDKIYVRDMPGENTPVAGDAGTTNRFIQRLNMREFVRIVLNGGVFSGAKGTQEGSRASFKFEWHSRLDIVADPSGNWIRKVTGVNDIATGLIDVTTPPP